MALVTITKDAQDPHATRCINYKAEGTLLECANKMLGEWEETPWMCVLMRGEDRFHPLREEWGEVELEENDKICFIVNIGEPITIIIAIVVILLVIAVLFLVSPASQDTPESGDPVFSIDGQKNQARLNQPIEDNFGTNKLYPSYIMQPYSLYKDNNQYLYQRFLLGHGNYTYPGNPPYPAGWEQEVVLLDDARTEDNANVLYDSLGNFGNSPNSRLTRHGHNNISICRQVNNIQMIASNQKGYTGYVGPFKINPPNTTVQQIANDISLPNGGYRMNKEGKMRSVGFGVRFEIREIDNNSNPVGDWVTLLSYSRSFRTAQAQRFTLYANAPYAARWEIRGIRTRGAITDGKGNNSYSWDLCKGYRGNVDTSANTNLSYYDFPWFSMETLASQNTQANKVTVLCTRSVLVLTSDFSDNWLGSSVHAPDETRNPIWAMVSILRCDWGGRMEGREQELMDIPAIRLAVAQAKEAGETFDWSFTKSMSVWNAIKMCCFVCRCTPIMVGGKLSVIRDIPSNIPIAIFNRENILEGSLKLTRRIWNNDLNDGLKATYLDHETWTNETVVATIGTQTASSPKTINLSGVTNRDQAQKLTNYLWASEYYNRQQIKFETDYSGIALTYGDVIKVCTDVSENGQDGYLSAIENNRIFTLSEIPVFSIEATHTIIFRKKNGESYGPFEVVAVAGEEYKVELADPLVQIDPLLIPIDEQRHQNPIYIFGPLEDDGYLCKINKVTSNSYDKMTIECVVENFGRFGKDEVTAPPIYYEPLDPIPVAPVVTNLQQTSYNEATRLVSFSWDAAVGAISYLVEYSLDGETFIQISNNFNSTTSSFTLPADHDILEEEVMLSVSCNITGGDTGQRATISVRVDAPTTLSDSESPIANILIDAEEDEFGDQVTLNTD